MPPPAEVIDYDRPSFLSRFRSLDPELHSAGESRDRLEEELAIEKGYVYASSYKSLNDPMEGIFFARERGESR